MEVTVSWRAAAFFYLDVYLLVSCSENFFYILHPCYESLCLSVSEVFYLLFQRRFIHSPMSAQMRIALVLFTWVSASRYLKMSWKQYYDESVGFHDLLTPHTALQSDILDNTYHNFNCKILNHLGICYHQNPLFPFELLQNWNEAVILKQLAYT